MKSYYVTRDQNAWRWKELPSFGWSYFTDQVVDKKTMQNYLTLNQKLNAVSISFVDNNLKPANIFEVRRKDNDIFEVSQNGGERSFNLYEWDFIPIEETDKYFHDRQTNEINEKADQLQGLPKIQFYKDNADQTTLTNYKTMLKERMNDNGIRQRLVNYDPDRVSQVYFPEDNLILQNRGYHNR